MSRTVSPPAQRPYGVVLVAQEWAVARSTHYHAARRLAGRSMGRKRGPKTLYSDADLTRHVRQVIETSPFTGEGHRKVWARLRLEGVRTSKPRVLRLMRAANLLAPSRPHACWGRATTRGRHVCYYPGRATVCENLRRSGHRGKGTVRY